MTLPKIINLRLTKRALAAVPGWSGHKDYADNGECLICQAVRQRFPGVGWVRVVPGTVRIDGIVFDYTRDVHEDAIVEAHNNPDTFKPFSIRLTRE